MIIKLGSIKKYSFRIVIDNKGFIPTSYRFRSDALFCKYTAIWFNYELIHTICKSIQISFETRLVRILWNNKSLQKFISIWLFFYASSCMCGVSMIVHLFLITIDQDSRFAVQKWSEKIMILSLSNMAKYELSQLEGSY